MVVLVMDNAPVNLRGELTKWLLEVKPGVFAGKISALVRQKLWERVCGNKGVVGAVLLYSMNNEQGFSMEMHGTPYRKVVDINGLQLITIEGEEPVGGDGDENVKISQMSRNLDFEVESGITENDT